MSLINDMLRDIDRRSGDQAIKPAALDGTLTVPPQRARRWPPSWVLLLAMTAVLGALAGILLYGLGGQPARPVPEPAQLAPSVAPSAPTSTAPVAASEQPAGDEAARHTETTAAPQPPAQAGKAVAAVPVSPSPTTSPSLTEPTESAVQAAPEAVADEPAPARPDREIPPGKLTTIGTPTVAGDAAGPDSVVSRPLPPVQAEAPPAPTARPQIRPTPAETASEHLAQALKALERGQADVAERDLRRALALEPDHAQALTAMAALLLQQGRRTELETLLGALLARAPDQAAPAVLLARLRAERGDTAGALQLIEALPAERLSAEALAVLATLQQRAGHHADAVANYRRALATGPQRGTTWAGLAISLEALAQPAEARVAWEAALAAGPLDAPLAQHARKRLAALGGHGE